MQIVIVVVNALISIHALLAESDCVEEVSGDTWTRDFYPRSPCGERQYLVRGQRPNWRISIHALLAESDIFLIIGPHSTPKFLSTLSLRRATVAPVLAVGRAGYFYPRSPCGERLAPRARDNSMGRFLSTLSLRRATANALKLANSVLFLSTLSLRRATSKINTRRSVKMISIHALLAESDSRRYPAILGRGISIHALLAESDRLVLLGWLRTLISIHALLAESDPGGPRPPAPPRHFYPRSPCGERP